MDLRATNDSYNISLKRYDKGSVSDKLHYRVGESGPNDEFDRSYAHTTPPLRSEAQTKYSGSRGYEALSGGTVNTRFVDVNSMGMSSIGIVSTLLHEAGHAGILAESNYNLVETSDHHKSIDLSTFLFEATLGGLTEYNTDKKLSYTEHQLKLLAATGLWGTSSVEKAFGLDRLERNSSDYNAREAELKAEANKLFFEK